MEKLPYSRQSIDAADISSVVSALEAELITQGPRILAFEQAFARNCGAEYAVAVSSGTSALILANQALGLNRDEVVITTPNTFVATANSIELNGGKTHLVDIDPLTFNIDPRKIEETLQTTKHVAGIIPVHFAGAPADMEAISGLAREYDTYVIEDACHALGGSWKDSHGQLHRIGDCSHSDICIFSFHPVKQITTGEGGMLTTNNSALYQKLLELRSHGISKPKNQDKLSTEPWFYEMHQLSANHRITDFQCALGLSQLDKSPAWISQRSKIVKRYDDAFEASERVVPQVHVPSGNVSYHLYVIQVPEREALYHYLHAHGIKVQVHYIPVYCQPYYREKYGLDRNTFPVCERYYSRTLSLPMYPGLTPTEQDHVIATVLQFFDESVEATPLQGQSGE